MLTTDLIYAAVLIAVVWREMKFKIFAERRLFDSEHEPDYGTWDNRNFVLRFRNSATYLVWFPALFIAEARDAVTIMALSTAIWEVLWQDAKTKDSMAKNWLVHSAIGV